MPRDLTHVFSFWSKHHNLSHRLSCEEKEDSMSLFMGQHQSSFVLWAFY